MRDYQLTDIETGKLYSLTGVAYASPWTAEKLWALPRFTAKAARDIALDIRHDYLEASRKLAALGYTFTVWETRESVPVDTVWEAWKRAAESAGAKYARDTHGAPTGSPDEEPLSGERAGAILPADVYRAVSWPPNWEDDTAELLEAWERGYFAAWEASSESDGEVEP